MLSLHHSSKISFLFQVKRFVIPKTASLKIFISSIFFTENIELESLSYVLCSDEYLLKINQQFLHHDDYTDIITFNLATNNLPIIGECYISINRVKDNAKLYNTSNQRELLHVIFHGALHLCGYLDKTHHDISIMRNKEDHYLNLFLST